MGCIVAVHVKRRPLRLSWPCDMTGSASATINQQHVNRLSAVSFCILLCTRCPFCVAFAEVRRLPAGHKRER
jgi:hypothetical protein